MKVLTQTATLLFCLTMFSGIVLAQVNTEYAQVAEDTDIMATIIDKTMKKTFNDEYRESGFFDAGCQGIYLKGYGVLFMMKIGFPVVKLPEENPVKEAKPDNLWDQTKRELKEGSFAYTYGSPTSDHIIGGGGGSAPYDQKKVEQLKDELLRLIGDYSNNIRSLQLDDNITIVIKGGKMNIMGITQWAGVGSQAMPNPVTYIKKNEYGGVYQAMPDPVTLPNMLSPDTAEAGAIPSTPASPPRMPKTVTAEAPSGISSTDTMPASPPPPMPKASTGISAVETPGVPIVTTLATYDHPMSFTAIGNGIGQKGSRSTMIITVKKRNIMELKEGRINSDEFAKRAEIIQY